MAARCFQNEGKYPAKDPYEELIASLTRLINRHSPVDIPPAGGLYYGSTSVGYLLAKLHLYYPDMLIERHHLGTWAAAYLKMTEKYGHTSHRPRAGKCGIAEDKLALLAIGAVSGQDADMAAQLCEYASVATHPDSESEWLYGRAGYLYYLRLAKTGFGGDKKTTEMVDTAADKVIQAILAEKRPWKWHDKAYVGAVHGTAGIITQIVLTKKRYAAAVEGDLVDLLDCQFDGGNWPSSLPPGSDRLVQVCHGAPGVISCLLSIKRYFPGLSERIETAIEKGRKCVVERGLLTKEPCLCHGISGNALALGDRECRQFLSRTSGNEIESLQQARTMDKSDSPESLWCGEAGRAWAWAVVDKDLPRRLLGFNDL